MYWNHRRTTGRLMVACAVASILAPTPPAHADRRGDAKRADRSVQQAAAILEDATTRAQAAAKQLAGAMAALPQAHQRVATTRGQVAAAQALANTARRRAAVAQTEYRATAHRFARAQERVEQARERVDTVVSAAYKGSPLTAITVIAEATGPQDALNRIGYVGHVVDLQQRDVDEFTRARRAARIEQDRAGAAKRAAGQAARDAVDTVRAARAAQRAAVQARAAVVALTASRRKALAVARSERGAVFAKYRRLLAEENRIRAALLDWDLREGGAGTAGGKLLTPVQGWMSSGFGMRLNPVYRIWRLHAGVDFAAPGGAPIRAAADGRVVTAGWSGGYGQYTCVSHGRYGGSGLSTCYGHQSAILVRSGQRVHRGQVIGLVGTTGASTGDHLHFEVRAGGVPRDPTHYLP